MCPKAYDKDYCLVVKVGTDERPASKSDIVDIKNTLNAIIDAPDAIIVTHHSVDFVLIPKAYIKNAVIANHNVDLSNKLT